MTYPSNAHTILQSATALANRWRANSQKAAEEKRNALRRILGVLNDLRDHNPNLRQDYHSRSTDLIHNDQYWIRINHEPHGTDADGNAQYSWRSSSGGNTFNSSGNWEELCRSITEVVAQHLFSQEPSAEGNPASTTT